MPSVTSDNPILRGGKHPTQYRDHTSINLEALAQMTRHYMDLKNEYTC